MIRAWVADVTGSREVAPEEAVRQAMAGAVNAWIDFESEDEPEVARVLRPLSIHPLVLEDMVTDLNRPKVDDFGDYLNLVVHSARWEEGKGAILREIDMVVGTRLLVTYHDGATRSISAAHQVLARRPELLARTPAALLHFLLDELVDHWLPIADQIAEHLDALEDEIFTRADERVHRSIVELKRGMLSLRRIIGPQRDTVLALTRDEFRPIPPELRMYLRDVYDRLARVSDLLDSFRDEVATLLELYVSMQSNRLNEVIKRLTVIATVGLPLTVITSYYGMNFRFAEYDLAHPGLFVLLLLVVSGLVTLALLKWKRWY